MNSFTGKLGLVLLLDENTNREAVRLSVECGGMNSIDLESRHMPHLTLYQANLDSVPTAEVDKVLDDVKNMLPIRLSFTQIAAFGGMFLFWDTARSEALMEAHERALDLSRFFVPIGEQQVNTDQMTLSLEENLNVQNYGYPLVRALWRPHVTLGCYPQGISREFSPQVFEGLANRVALVRVGEAGTLTKIIDQRT